MSEDRPRAVGRTIAEAVCLLAAILLYLLTLSVISELGQSDPAGNAMAAGFAFIFALLAWIPLTAFVVLAWRSAKRAELLAIGLFLCLAGMVASVWAVGLMQEPSWVRITPTALPLVALAYGIWMRLGAKAPRRWRWFPLALFLAPAAAAALPVIIEQQRWDAAAPEREEALRKAVADQERAERDAAARRQAELRALGPDSRLEALFTHLMSENEEEAIARIRTLRSAQADAVRLLDADTELFEFRGMPRWGLTVTPELCRSYRRRIERKLTEFEPGDPNANDNAVELATYVENYRWLHGNGCSMADLAARTAAQLRRHPNDSVRADGVMFDEIR